MTQYWAPRMKTKRGSINPPRTDSYRIGSASTARRRFQERVDDVLRKNDYVQVTPGVIVVFQRKPWIILAIDERPVDLWDEKFEQRWEANLKAWEQEPHGERPERATWPWRPIAYQVVSATSPREKPLHLITQASYYWTVLPEHYPICVACGELPPCRHEIAEIEADRQMAYAEVRMNIPAGACLACGEAIGGRQKSQRFPGPNLWRPDLADGSAVFHARQECGVLADRYAAQWRARAGQATDPQPSLFTDTTDGGHS